MRSLLLFHAIAMLPAAAASAESRFPPEAFDRAPQAADHWAIEEVERLHQTPSTLRYEIVRSGSWLRHGSGANGAAYSDFQSGVSLYYRLGEDGHLDALSVSRQDADGSFVRTKTDQVDQALGETCEVWRTTPSRSPVTYLTCETPDGIRLWSRVMGDGGTVLSSSRTIEFRRRRVELEEVRPPRRVLNWAYWRRLAETSTAARPTSLGKRFTVRLEALEGGGAPWQVMRRRGGWSYYERGTFDGGSNLTIHLTAFHASIQYEGADRKPVRFHINRQRSDQLPLASWHYEAVEPREAEIVLGEECVWSKEGGGIVITSGSHSSCVTADGIPLKIYSHHRALIANLTATEVDRGTPGIREMVPPRHLFDWRTWGIDLSN